MRLVNSHATNKSTISVANTVAASFTLLPNSSEIVEKDIGAAVTASGGTVTGAPVAFNIQNETYHRRSNKRKGYH